MKARGGGSVVNIASMSARLIRPNDGGYSTSKGALLTATKSMAIDLAPYKIRVNAVVPGWIWGPNVQMYIDWQVSERGITPEEVDRRDHREHPARRDPAAGGHRRGDRVLRVGHVAHDHRPVARRERRGVLRMTDAGSSPARSRWSPAAGPGSGARPRSRSRRRAARACSSPTSTTAWARETVDLVAAAGGEALFVATDVTNPEAVDRDGGGARSPRSARSTTR